MRRGIISSVDIDMKVAKVTFPDMDNVVTDSLPVADHIPLSGDLMLKVGDVVYVDLPYNNFSDGAVIARI